MTKRQVLAAIYVRISKDRKGQSVGVQRQEKECRALADSRGISITDVYSDNDISAYSGRPRPGYQDLCADIASGKINTVIAWHEDRLHRHTMELETYMGLCEPRDIATIFVQSGELDLQTASGRMVARIKGAVARAESEHKSERTRAAYRDAIEKGRALGGPRCFGLNEDRQTHRPDEVKAIRLAYKMIMDGESINAVRQEFNRRGIVTVNGNAWQHQTVKQVLRSPRMAGLIDYKGTLYTAAWKPMISESEWREMLAVLDHRGKGHVGQVAGQPLQHKYLGTGLYWCHCGNSIVAAGGANPVTGFYACRSLQFGGSTCRVGRQRRLVDGYVLGAVRERLKAVSVEPQTPEEQDRSDLEDEIQRQRDKLSTLSRLFADDTITGDQFGESSAAVRKHIAKLEEQLQDREPARARVLTNSDPLAALDSSSVDRQRAIIDAMCVVTLTPIKMGRPKGWKKGESYFQGQGVEIQWKGDGA